MTDLDRAARAWYGGKLPPDTTYLKAIEAMDAAGQPLYLLEHGREQGELAPILQQLRHKLSTRPSLAQWPSHVALTNLLTTLFDHVATERERALLLRQLGEFIFATEEHRDNRREKIITVLRDFERDPDQVESGDSEVHLMDFWSPPKGSLLDVVLFHPKLLPEILCKRLDPVTAPPLRIIGHSILAMDPALLRRTAASQCVAFEQQRSIHLLSEAIPALEEPHPQDPEGLLPIETLILHELVELIIDETTALDPLPAHIVATTFERCLHGLVLTIAVEQFFRSGPFS